MNSESRTSTSLYGDVSELLQRALALHKQGSLAEASALYRTILEIDEGHFDARHMLGAVALQLGKFDEAITSISAALQRRPC